MPKDPDPEELPSDPVPSFDVTVIVHTMDKESQKIEYNGITANGLEQIITTVNLSHNVIKSNNSLTLVDTRDTLYIFNVDNITCVEIRR